MKTVAGLLLSLAALLAAEWYIRQPSREPRMDWFTLHNDGGGV